MRLACLVAFGAVGIWGHAHLIGFIGQQHASRLGATETMLGLALESPASGPELVRLLATAPPGSVVLLIPQGDAATAMLGNCIASLVWPRKFLSVALKSDDRTAKFADAMALKPGVLLFYRLPAPMPGGKPVGPNLIYFAQ